MAMGSRELEEAAEHAVSALLSGKLTPEKARIAIAGLRVIGRSHAARIDHARLTGRFIKGSSSLPEYTSPARARRSTK